MFYQFGKKMLIAKIVSYELDTSLVLLYVPEKEGDVKVWSNIYPLI